MRKALDLRRLLSELAAADCRFVVIGSSALAMHGWKVVPEDLDLMVEPNVVDLLARSIGDSPEPGIWAVDGEARRLECQTSSGPVDLYTEVSGGLLFEVVERSAITLHLGNTDKLVKVGSLEHIRTMRAAAGRASLAAEVARPGDQEGAPDVIAIDGPAGAGKSTVSRAVARELGFTYLNTGAMYRCVALALMEGRADTDDPKEVWRIAKGADITFEGERVLLAGQDVSEAIRRDDVTEVTSHIAAYPEVREAMVRRQRLLFAKGMYVAEGRDTGTVVTPDAPLKVYLTADVDERAKRRALETKEPVSQVRRALEERDRLDSERELSALRAAEDAVMVDTTGRSVEDVVDEIASLARQRGLG